MAELTLDRAPPRIYPERETPTTSGEGSRRANSARLRLRTQAFVAATLAHAEGLESASATELDRVRDELRNALLRKGLRRPLVARTFALVREQARRTLGMTHYKVQIAGGWILANQRIAELATGEGKTLVATLPACTAALAGIPVHLVTANGYLVERDAQAMAPLYRALGLRVGAITAGADFNARRAAYRCDITYCTGKQLTFDYLRDRLTLGPNPGHLRLALEPLGASDPRSQRLLLRGLHYAILDEADSILIDEARTPLVLAREGTALAQTEALAAALETARLLRPGEDFKLDRAHRDVQLTARGRERALEQTTVENQKRKIEARVCTALAALHLYRNGRDYLVGDGRVQIIDANTGRLMPDRSWSRELHQMIELIEGCATSTPHETVARTSFQNFFARYVNLAGMTGTAREVSRELMNVYGLEVVRVSTRLPVRRHILSRRIFADHARHALAVSKRVEQMVSDGRPVLIGTRSVAESERLSAALRGHAVEHSVLNAAQNADEAAIVARAGQAGRVTVATNMAGRGTDIVLSPEVIARGGLHVIAAELNDARRIDRQLFGRCARQGDPGSAEVMLSLEDALLTGLSPRLCAGLRTLAAGEQLRPGWLGRLVSRLVQRRVERSDRNLRKRLARANREFSKLLAFSGAPE